MRTHKHPAFTLVELIAVIVILAALSAVAVPRLVDYSSRATVVRMTSNFKTIYHAYMEYYQTHGAWPPDNDGSTGQPFRAEPFLTTNLWETASPIGGYWNWNVGLTGNSTAWPADVCIYSVGTPSSRATQIMTQVDANLDDGNLSTGRFRFEQGSWGGTYRYFLAGPGT